MDLDKYIETLLYKKINGHTEVYDKWGKFICSADVDEDIGKEVGIALTEMYGKVFIQ